MATTASLRAFAYCFTAPPRWEGAGEPCTSDTSRAESAERPATPNDQLPEHSTEAAAPTHAYFLKLTHPALFV